MSNSANPVQVRELSTIQKREKLNSVLAVELSMKGGACHDYAIFDATTKTPFAEADQLAAIKFQDGARKEPESKRGVLDTDLLEIVRDRLRGFQSGQFACRENACALTHIEEALMWMNRRVEDRIERNVLGKDEK